MAKTLYIATTEAESGKSLVSLGLLELILRKTPNVGILRPIIHSQGITSDKDDHLTLLHSRVEKQLAFDECYAMTREKAADLLSRGHLDEMVEAIIGKYKAMESKMDFVLVEGTDFEGEGAAFELNVNAEIARNLSAPVLIVQNAHKNKEEELFQNINQSIDSFEKNECKVVGVVINRVIPDLRESMLEKARKELPDGILVYAIPEDRVLGSPTILEVKEQLGAKVIHGEEHLDRLAYGIIVAAMQVPHFIQHLSDKQAVITPGDRHDIIMASVLAHHSKNYPSLAGIILTGGFSPEPQLLKLLDGLRDDIPLLTVEADTFETSQRVFQVKSKLNIRNKRKIRLGIQLFQEYVDTQAIEEQVIAFQPRGVTPGMFLFTLQQKAREQKMHIVLPEGEDERILRATEHLLNHELVKITLIGKVEEVERKISRLGLNFSREDFQILDPQSYEGFEDFVNTFYGLRKHKGLTTDIARDVMADVSYFGTMMVYKGLADGMVSGAQHTTQHTIRPALQFIKTQPGFHVVSSIFFMALDDRVLVYGDCAVNPNPSAEELAEIGIASAETSKTFGITPRVAMLSYSSGSSGKGEDVEKVRKATSLIRERRPDLQVEGPLQYDAAVDPGVAAKKMPDSEVAGRATVLIFPDLNTGNNTYKAVQRETGAMAIGPMLQGLNKPVNDLSRGATIEDVINTVIITAIQAQEVQVRSKQKPQPA